MVDWFETAKIQTRPYFAGNIMLQPAYDHLVDPVQVAGLFPNATKVMRDTFFLGTSPVVIPEQIDYIGEKTTEFMNRLKQGSI